MDFEIIGNWEDGTSQKATAYALALHDQFDAAFAQGGSTGTRRAILDPHGANGRRGRERLQEADRQAWPRRPQGPLQRPVAGARRHLDQGRDLDAVERDGAAAELGADPGRRLHQSRGRRELLIGSHRQFFYAQRVSAMRRQHHGGRNHGRDRGRRGRAVRANSDARQSRAGHRDFRERQ